MAAPMIYLIFLLCTLISVSAQVFLGIDCGSSSDSYKDENLITWVRDDNYIQNGVSHSVPTDNSISRVLDTLRVFTARRKNCYYIDSIRRGRVLVRASFYYGNYDGRSLPPSFDLQFDGNDWVTVETSITDYVYYEVTYVMKMDSISVCVAQTRTGEFPFISAIEVRGLETYTYGVTNANYPLFLSRRVAFGSNATIRFTDDPYDRIWTPEVPNNMSLRVSSDAFFSSITILNDIPPPAVLKHAITTTSPNSSLELTWAMGFPTVEVPVPVYINWYFSEMTRLSPNQTRSFQIFKDNESFSRPILPPYENCSQLYTYGMNASSGATTISLVPTNDSTLPPLISALEVFVIGNELTNGTNTNDVEGLASLQRAFVLLQDWRGDPCLPAPYTWDWIHCSNETTPRVTSLLLGSFGLSGMFPNFSSMDALQTIDVHNNSLGGPIPDFLGRLPHLQTLNLANNNFTGSVPASLLNKNGLDLVTSGNPDLCTSGASCLDSNSTRNSSGSEKNTIDARTMFGTLIPSIIVLHLGRNLL